MDLPQPMREFRSGWNPAASQLTKSTRFNNSTMALRHTLIATHAISRRASQLDQPLSTPHQAAGGRTLSDPGLSFLAGARFHHGTAGSRGLVLDGRSLNRRDRWHQGHSYDQRS